jgi:DNA polymerase III delta prime subunit
VANGGSPSSKLPIVVAGPTGVGKTASAVDLANELDGEIIGADAYQVYRGLEILTGQPTPEMLSAVPHHLIGFLPPTEVLDAGRFATIMRERISEVISRGKVFGRLKDCDAVWKGDHPVRSGCAARLRAYMIPKSSEAQSRKTSSGARIGAQSAVSPSLRG